MSEHVMAELESNADWHGYLALDNAEVVAARLRRLLRSRRYTIASVGPLAGEPIGIRTGQRLRDDAGDWAAAVTALAAGELPSSHGEQKMLRMAASLAGQAQVILGDDITGLDDRNIQILVKAGRCGPGRRELADVRQELPRVEARLGAALDRSEARQQNAHQQLAGRLEAREQRAARVDAHGIWPIGAGIVMTGIPGELAAPAVLGWLFMAAGIGVTLHAARAVLSDRVT